jgi:hypothetical protein
MMIAMPALVIIAAILTVTFATFAGNLVYDLLFPYIVRNLFLNSRHESINLIDTANPARHDLSKRNSRYPGAAE